ncbi:cell division protein FtsX [Desulfolithobacter sp.]
MNFIYAVISQTGRNLRQTWSTQILSLITIGLSVLIFSFFYLIYTNVLDIGRHFGDDLRLVAYLDEEPGPRLQDEYRRKILKFDQVEKIIFISREQAFDRFAAQLGRDRDILADMPRDFLPPSMEIYPHRSLTSLTRIKRFSDYIQTLPGVLRVQYGQDWVERFYSFVQLLRVVVLLSGALLVLVTSFMVAHSLRLAILGRQQELELLRLVGATNNYIRMPFFIEGAMQGLLGSSLGLTALYLLFNWIKLRFAGSALLELFPFTFFPLPVLGGIIGVATLLCASGSYFSTRKFLRL